MANTEQETIDHAMLTIKNFLHSIAPATQEEIANNLASLLGVTLHAYKMNSDPATTKEVVEHMLEMINREIN